MYDVPTVQYKNLSKSRDFEHSIAHSSRILHTLRKLLLTVAPGPGPINDKVPVPYLFSDPDPGRILYPDTTF
jgi:hypothetical protein